MKGREVAGHSRAVQYKMRPSAHSPTPTDCRRKRYPSRLWVRCPQTIPNVPDLLLGDVQCLSFSVVESSRDAISKGIKEDGSVSISGFGTFSRKSRAARRGRNPRTGEIMQIPASTTVGFKPAENLKNTFQQT